MAVRGVGGGSVGKVALEPTNVTMIHTGVRFGPAPRLHNTKPPELQRGRELRAGRQGEGTKKSVVCAEDSLQGVEYRPWPVCGGQIGYAAKLNYCFRLKLKLGRHESFQDEPRMPDGSDAATSQKKWLARRHGRGLHIPHRQYSVIMWYL
jgi:hypothetical protein